MADALLGLARFRWFAFRHSPLSQHRDPAMARPMLNAAAAEPESLLSRMGTTPQGLTAEEVAVRLRAVGPNLVAHDRRQSLFAELVGRARNPLNFQLLSLAAVSYFLGDRRAAAVITVMVVLSVTLAFVQQQTAHLNADGFRVISVAYKEIVEPRLSYRNEDEGDLTLLGYIAFLDPPKESAGIAIATLARSGVQVKILTGDNDIIARKICREVGVVTDDVLIGGDLDKLTDEELAQRLETVTLCAKVSPAQKARIIEALHRRDHVVGFLGDGINDGPALKSADVGISVDTAVDIAKESADIILLEKSLTVLSEGVLEGRKIFGNIVKYIKMGASSNFGNMFSVLGASIFLPFLPMAPIQVLTNNLLYDFSQTTIPTDNVDDEYIAAPRRWDIGNITKVMLCLGPISSIFDYVTYATLLWVFAAWNNPSLFQTGWFVESLLTQTLIIHIIRTARIPFLQSRASNALIMTTILVACAGAVLPYSPLGPILGFVPLPGSYWVAVFMIILGYCVLAHLVKSWFVRRWGL